ncbi:MAG: AAA family ATPase [Bacteroidetes bacterium]|nr:MAG: AAA family ATPase [Bacteroidota bacterium]TAG88207.1 MAG: AAA family ATPase [Bacteroidota bacterium]
MEYLKSQKNLENSDKISANYSDFLDYECKVEIQNYFVALNHCIPNVSLIEKEFNIDKLLETLQKKYEIPTDNIWKAYNYDNTSRKSKLEYFCIQLEKGLMLCADKLGQFVKILFGNNIATTQIEDIVSVVKKNFLKRKADRKVYLLHEKDGHLYLKPFDVKRIKVDVKNLYNDDFLEIHKLIAERLNTTDDKGIVLLHGVPGTGKTSYIRYLTSLIRKKMIYISPEFAHKISSPSFLPLLLDNPNSVLIIEDSENVIESRENNDNQAVSNLLNVADGLLADCLNIQIICTFNTNISKVDKALLRKGRLIAVYEFKELEQPKAQKLSDKLGYKTEIKIDMTLSDIYNQNAHTFDTKEREKIGF